MEGRRKALNGSVWLLLLVAAMMMGRQQVVLGGRADFKKCYDDCMKNCNQPIGTEQCSIDCVDKCKPPSATGSTLGYVDHRGVH
ncbi:unnamed protein product [Linum trigynum]|uniref:Uncharacterized protein n=1 Tax=Linum trigynum TaxID=586398 RepID=A0AAV2GEX1_9ROSI